MPSLTINGQNREIENLSIEAVLRAENLPREDWSAVAIAQNGRIVPKAVWEKTALNENDRIEIVRAFAGG